MVHNLGFGLVLLSAVAGWQSAQGGVMIHICSLLSRLSLGMMVNNYPMLCTINAIVLRLRPLPCRAPVWIAWASCIWLASAASALVQWCRLEAPAVALLNLIFGMLS